MVMVSALPPLNSVVGEVGLGESLCYETEMMPEWPFALPSHVFSHNLFHFFAFVNHCWI